MDGAFLSAKSRPNSWPVGSYLRLAHVPLGLALRSCDSFHDLIIWQPFVVRQQRIDVSGVQFRLNEKKAAGYEAHLYDQLRVGGRRGGARGRARLRASQPSWSACKQTGVGYVNGEVSSLLLG